WPLASARWIRECERLVELERLLPAVLKGEHAPADAGERAELAGVCLLKRQFRTAACWYAEAFAAQPALATDLQAGRRLAAARSAALVGCGQGEEAAVLDEAERARWRRQALDWLRADLTLLTQRLHDGPPAARAQAQRLLQSWQRDRALE